MERVSFYAVLNKKARLGNPRRIPEVIIYIYKNKLLLENNVHIS